MRDQRQTRLNRIARCASPAIREAYEQGKISTRRADILLHMEPGRAESTLATILAKQDQIAARSPVAVKIIREHLLLGRRDLVALASDLRAALSTEQTVF